MATARSTHTKNSELKWSPRLITFINTNNKMTSDSETPKKAKKSKSKTSESDGSSNGKISKTYEERVMAVNIISRPLASKKSTKKIHKLVKKASSNGKHVRRGVKEVVKGIRKGEKGLAIIAGDIFPIDVISHLPVLLEENGVPYIFVPSKQDLGIAASTKRPTSVVLVTVPKDGKSDTFLEKDGQEIYDHIYKEAQEYDPSTI